MSGPGGLTPRRLEGGADGGRAAWEDRGAHFGTGLRGVLFQGLPDLLNQAIDVRHRAWVEDDFPPGPDTIRILDVGSGYGRLSHAIRSRNSAARLVGLDLAATYASHYLREVAPPRTAVTGDCERLPFQVGTFDRVVAVTALMYLPADRLSVGLSEIARVLVPGGRVLVVEPGAGFLWGVLRDHLRGPGGSEGWKTGGKRIREQNLRGVAAAAGFRVESVAGMPFFSLFFPILALLARGPGGLFRIATMGLFAFDEIFASVTAGSLYLRYRLVKSR